MIYIGCHLSVAQGYTHMAETMVDYGGDTFAFFLRSPRGGAAKDIDPEDAADMNAILQEHAFGPLVAHAPYTMNLAAAKEDVRRKAENMLRDDLERMDTYFPGNYYNFHPGSHVGQGVDIGIYKIAESLNNIVHADCRTTVLLETMAGKGSEIGRSFEELRELLDRVECPEKFGVCLDTCHIWDGGYDIAGQLDDVLMQFDLTIGLDRLYAVHLNDSKNICGSHKDRHEKLGQGEIGEAALRAVVQHPSLQGRPFILETPNEPAGYKKEIAAVKEWRAK